MRDWYAFSGRKLDVLQVAHSVLDTVGRLQCGVSYQKRGTGRTCLWYTNSFIDVFIFKHEKSAWVAEARL